MQPDLRSALVLAVALVGSSAAQAHSFGDASFFGDNLKYCFDLGSTIQSVDALNLSDQRPSAIGARHSPTKRSNLAVGGAVGQTVSNTLFDRPGADRTLATTVTMPGRTAGGFDLDPVNGLGGVVSGSSAFGRSYGDDRTAGAGLGDRF